jgi:hypothetical protein
MQEWFIRRIPSVNYALFLKVFLFRCVEQMVTAHPQLLSYTPEKIKLNVKFLVTRVGFGEAELMKVQYCLSCSYAFD